MATPRYRSATFEDQNVSVARAISAIQGCLPLDVTPGLGGAIADRQIFFGDIGLDVPTIGMVCFLFKEIDDAQVRS